MERLKQVAFYLAAASLLIYFIAFAVLFVLSDSLTAAEYRFGTSKLLLYGTAALIPLNFAWCMHRPPDMGQDSLARQRRWFAVVVGSIIYHAGVTPKLALDHDRFAVFGVPPLESALSIVAIIGGAVFLWAGAAFWWSMRPYQESKS